MGGADYFAAACFHDALFDKVCFGQKNKNQIGRLSVAFSLFFDSFALRECFWDFNFAVRYFCFFSIWFLKIVIMAFYEGKFMIDKFFDRYLYIWDLISIFLYALLVVLQLSKIINTVI